MKYLLSIAAIALAGTGWVRGATEAIAGYTDSISGYVSGTVGWTFQATRALTVTELGCFADVFVINPTVASIQVGLWSTNGTLLASNSVAAASPLFGQTRYESVAPVMLDPGQTYHLGVFYFANSIGVDVAGAVAGGSVSTAVGVQLGWQFHDIDIDGDIDVLAPVMQPDLQYQIGNQHIPAVMTCDEFVEDLQVTIRGHDESLSLAVRPCAFQAAGRTAGLPGTLRRGLIPSLYNSAVAMALPPDKAGEVVA